MISRKMIRMAYRAQMKAYGVRLVSDLRKVCQGGKGDLLAYVEVLRG